MAAAGSPVTVDASWDLARRVLLAILALGALGYSISLFRGRRAPILGIGTLVAGLGTLVAGALSYAESATVTGSP